MNVRKSLRVAAGSGAGFMPALAAILQEMPAGALRPALHSLLLENSAARLVDFTKDHAWAL